MQNTCFNCYSEKMKQLAQKNANDAFNTERSRTRDFDAMAHLNAMSLNVNEDGLLEELPQPDKFQGNLKGYQIKGLTWLANLYDQGISGILADGKKCLKKILIAHI